MKYRNASEILPDGLLKELQKYVSGEILYVPSDKTRKKWGADTGARYYYESRNAEIRHKYFHLKAPLGTLCEEYNLSDETVRKILYK
jgi:hypothetical protein